MKIYLDPGHGGSDPGARGNGLYEKDIVLDIALKIRNILQREFEHVQVKMSRTKDTTKSLQQRTNEANAWGADYYLSIHCNSFDGSANGYEDYIHTSLADSSRTAKIRNSIHEAVIKSNGLKDRGKKKADFHVLRESSMPACLTENGFIDSKPDAALMKSSSWREKVAYGHVNGLAKAFNLKRKTKTEEVRYFVIAGSFQSKENAQKQTSALKQKGIDSFVEAVTVSGVRWYRVQAGAFAKRENAEKRVQEIRNLGISAFYIVK